MIATNEIDRSECYYLTVTLANDFHMDGLQRFSTQLTRLGLGDLFRLLQ